MSVAAACVVLTQRAPPPTTSPLTLLASFLVVTVIVGIPVVHFYHLWQLRYPFNRLFAADEDGLLHPTKQGKAVVGTLYTMFRPNLWLWNTIDTSVKLLFTGLVGLIFTAAQPTGMITMAFLSGLIHCNIQPLVSPIYLHLLLRVCKHRVLTQRLTLIAGLITGCLFLSLSCTQRQTFHVFKYP